MDKEIVEEVPTVLEVNCATGEQVIRPMTSAEIEQRAIDSAAAAEAEALILAEQAAKEEAKMAAISKLMALGLTEEEALSLGVS